MSRLLQEYRVYFLASLISIVIGSLGAFAWAKLIPHQTQTPQEFYEVKTYVDTEFPDFGLSTYSGSEKLNDYLSARKVLLVVISASCGGCKYEIELLKSADFLRNSGIEVALIGIEKDESIARFLEENNLDVPIFDDRYHTMRDRFDLKVTPVNFLIINGRLDRTWNGSPATVEDLLKKVGSPLQSTN